MNPPGHPLKRSRLPACILALIAFVLLALSILRYPYLYQNKKFHPQLQADEPSLLARINGVELWHSPHDVIKPAGKRWPADPTAFLYPLATVDPNDEDAERPGRLWIRTIEKALTGQLADDFARIAQDAATGRVPTAEATFTIPEGNPYANGQPIRSIYPVPALSAFESNLKDAIARAHQDDHCAVAVPLLKLGDEDDRNVYEASLHAMLDAAQRSTAPDVITIGTFALSDGRNKYLRETLTAAWKEVAAVRPFKDLGVPVDESTRLFAVAMLGLAISQLRRPRLNNPRLVIFALACAGLAKSASDVTKWVGDLGLAVTIIKVGFAISAGFFLEFLESKGKTESEEP